MPTRKNLEDLFSETLKDIYFAEKQFYAPCPKWPRKPRRLSQQAFETHRTRRKAM